MIITAYIPLKIFEAFPTLKTLFILASNNVKNNKYFSSVSIRAKPSLLGKSLELMQ